MIAPIAFVVTLLPPSAFAEARTSFARSQIDSHVAKTDSETAEEIEIVPHKTVNPKCDEILITCCKITIYVAMYEKPTEISGNVYCISKGAKSIMNMPNKETETQVKDCRITECRLCTNHCRDCRYLEMDNDYYNDGTRRCDYKGRWVYPSDVACGNFSY